MRRFILSDPTISPQENRAHNSINGSDAESFAMAKILIACRGEGHWGSRNDDCAKIDLIFTFKHPWIANERVLILCQVKSGETYGEIQGNTATLSRSAVLMAKRTSHDILLVWVDRKSNRLFWAYLHENSKASPFIAGHHHEISPATTFDLARCMSSRRVGAQAANGIVIRERLNTLIDRRKKNRQIYRDYSAINSPVLGPINITRLAWRHMFRKGRVQKNKAASMNMIPYLKKIINQWPSSHSIVHYCYRTDKYGYTTRTCEHLLKFDRLKIDTKQKENYSDATAIIRVIEEIRYPLNWEINAMLSQQVERIVVLKSAYYKLKQ